MHLASGDREGVDGKMGRLKTAVYLLGTLCCDQWAVAVQRPRVKESWVTSVRHAQLLSGQLIHKSKRSSKRQGRKLPSVLIAAAASELAPWDPSSCPHPRHKLVSEPWPLRGLPVYPGAPMPTWAQLHTEKARTGDKALGLHPGAAPSCFLWLSSQGRGRQFSAQGPLLPAHLPLLLSLTHTLPLLHTCVR